MARAMAITALPLLSACRQHLKISNTPLTNSSQHEIFFSFFRPLHFVPLSSTKQYPERIAFLEFYSPRLFLPSPFPSCYLASHCSSLSSSRELCRVCREGRYAWEACFGSISNFDTPTTNSSSYPHCALSRNPPEPT